MTSWPNVYIPDGTDQGSRIPSALEANYFNVDEMTPEELLAMGAELASALRFINVKNEKDGTWADLFLADEAVVMALILSTNVKRLESDFLRAAEFSLRRMATCVYRLAKAIDFWFRTLQASDGHAGKLLSLKMAEVIQGKLAAELAVVRAYTRRLTRQGDVQTTDFGSFAHMWGIGQTEGPLVFPQSKLSNATSATEAHSHVRSAFYSFLHAIAYFKKSTARSWQDTFQSQTHNPAIGLFIAFLRLFEKAQDTINTFSQRHLSFYYHQCLQAVPMRFVPESAYLLCAPAALNHDVFVSKGTVFTAGKDDDQHERLYRADDCLVVTDAQVKLLYTLYLERDRLIVPERELQYVTRAQTIRVLLPGSLESDRPITAWPLFGAGEKRHGLAEHAEMGFAIASPILFLKEGRRKIDITLHFKGPAASDEASGRAPLELLKQAESSEAFAKQLGKVFSRYLLTGPERHCFSLENVQWRILLDKKECPEGLRQEFATHSCALVGARIEVIIEGKRWSLTSGERTYQIRQEGHRVTVLEEWLTEEDKQLILERVQRWSDPAVSYQAIRALFGGDREALAYTFLNNLFTISLTTEQGWHDVGHYTMQLHRSEMELSSGGLTCSLTLGPGIAPITSYMAEVHGGRWKTQLPVIRFCLNAQSTRCAYSLFEDQPVRDIAIETAVEEVNDVLVYNNYGQLDPSKPFQPFGPLPTVHSYMVVGNYEMARKKLVELKLKIEWGDLPKDAGGFRSYYQGYGPPLSTESFQVELLSLQDGHWQPAQDSRRQKIALFDAEKTEGRINETRVLPVDILHGRKPIGSTLSEEEYRFGVNARNGFFKMALVAPDDAFGHREYAPLLAQVLSQNAKLKSATPIPNSPYTPLIKRMGLEYTAKSHLHVESGLIDANDAGEMVFHLHPFGVETVFPSEVPTSPTLLPQYHYDGNLFIGLSARRLKGPLTLLFHLSDDSTQEPSCERPEITWFYLASNRWRRLDQSCVVSDTTDGFLSSGVVTLNLPDQINQDNTIMSEDLSWLRVSANTLLDSFCSLYSVQAHALKVTRCDSGSPVSPKTLQAGIQCRPVVSIPGLGKVRQIGDAFGRRPAESRTQLNTRLSERLRHKYRASTPWDYERLILGEFPGLFKVKCFPHTMFGKAEPHPGHVLIVVVPYVKAGERSNDFRAMVNAHELNRIHTFIHNLAAPCVEIEVRNPVYEQIQIRCTVKFTTDLSSGLSLERLNGAINDYLSPWHELGCKARFGWCIRREDIESYLRGLDYVDAVTNLSMLHITEDDQDRFSLEDTAAMTERRPRTDHSDSASLSAHGASEEIRPKYPWSLAIPIRTHFIQTMDRRQTIQAKRTGLNELEIGTTLIIGSTQHG
ncbi:hypothetical protein [Nitrospira sp. Nam74]